VVKKRRPDALSRKGHKNVIESTYQEMRIVYYVMRSKNEVLCAAAGRLTAERSEADKPAKAHKTIFALSKKQRLANQNVYHRLKNRPLVK
jgi:hypothetical protein